MNYLEVFIIVINIFDRSVSENVIAVLIKYGRKDTSKDALSDVIIMQ